MFWQCDMCGDVFELRIFAFFHRVIEGHKNFRNVPEYPIVIDISESLRNELSAYRERIRQKYPNQKWTPIHLYSVMVKQFGDLLVAAELGRPIDKDVKQLLAAGLEYLEQ